MKLSGAHVELIRQLRNVLGADRLDLAVNFSPVEPHLCYVGCSLPRHNPGIMNVFIPLLGTIIYVGKKFVQFQKFWRWLASVGQYHGCHSLKHFGPSAIIAVREIDGPRNWDWQRGNCFENR